MRTATQVATTSCVNRKPKGTEAREVDAPPRGEESAPDPGTNSLSTGAAARQ